MRKNISITTAIPYVNGAPHIGHVLDVLQADVLARYYRNSATVFFLTGTDEHGQKNFKTAKDQGVEVSSFVRKNSDLFKASAAKLNISFDYFIRTEDENHKKVSQALWQKIDQAGDIYKKNYQGLYCVGCEVYLTEEDLDEKGHCPYHNKPPEKVKEENYFFKLSKYQAQLKEAIESGQFQVVPQKRQNEILAFINHGLEDISFSRPKDKLPWGIEVPGDPKHVMYVWCDALTNYLTGISLRGNKGEKGNTGYTGEKSTEGEFWPPTIQVIGKDILRFHAAIWPAMLISADLALPKTLLVHGFISVNGQKLAKSTGNIIDPIEYINQYGADALRYYLLREIPTTEDGDFSHQRFVDLYNADLANNLGNLVNRVIAMANQYGAFDFAADYLLSLAKKIDRQIEDLQKFEKEDRQQFCQLIENFKFNRALEYLWQKIDDLNRQIDREKPWQAAKLPGQDQIKIMVGIYLFKLQLIAHWLEPFLPETAKKILNQLASRTPQVLFPRIEE